jgi:hypothetical protein
MREVSLGNVSQAGAGNGCYWQSTSSGRTDADNLNNDISP